MCSDHDIYWQQWQSWNVDIWSNFQVIVAPKVLLNKRNHRVVTDQEDVQERNWMNKGKVSLCSQMVSFWGVSANLISSSSYWLIHFNKSTFPQLVLILLIHETTNHARIWLANINSRLIRFHIFYLRCKMRGSKPRSISSMTLTTPVRAAHPPRPSLHTTNLSPRSTKLEKMKTLQNISKYTKIRFVF